MNFIGTGRALSGEDYARAAKAIGCEEAVIRAVTVVEARGQGFDAKKRPVILFEPHVFWRCLPTSKRGEAQRLGLAYPKWRPGNYPGTQDARYAQLERAMLIDRDAALMACSWGLGQVLGENWQMCKFTSVEAFVRKNLEGEGGQLDVMVAFIIGAGLGKHLRAKNWAGFARGYNGPGYAKNQYDKKLATAYARLSKGASIAYDPLADGLLSVGDKGDVVKALQIALGIQADGDFGPLTEQAVERLQREHGLTVDGKVGKQTGALLGLHYWGSVGAAPTDPTPVEPKLDTPKTTADATAKVAAAASLGAAAAIAAWWGDFSTWIGGLFQ
jgi:peptidoglycan hydrolase-like protein with peptidoglycan-binding domain